MKLSKVLLLTLCLLALVPQLALTQESDAVGRLRRRAGAIPNNYIVVFKDSVPQGRVKAFAAQLARTHGGTIGFTYQHALRGFSVDLSEAQALALSRNPQVEYVEEDTLIEGVGVQSDPTWALDRIDQRLLPLNAAYNYANSGAGVNAYIIDSGIRFKHQEFGERVLFAYDNVADGRNGEDCIGHGTHVAGIIGGKTYGVAKDAKLWAVRVINCQNQGSSARNIAGIDWVIANHVKPAVANLSFITIVGNDSIDLAVRNLIAAGVTTVVAAGNNTGDASLRSPARVMEAITVAATDQFDHQSPNSNFGSVVDLYAPGVDIVSAWHFDNASYQPRSGTSFAAPFVAGLAARYLASRPGDQPDAVGQAIINAATPGKVINPGAGSPNLLAYAGITLSDDFNDNVRDPTKWHAPAAPDFTMVETNGRLEITPGANATSYDGYKSATTVDLTDARASIEVSAAHRIDSFGIYFTLGHSTGNNLMFGLGGSHFVLQQEVGGFTTTTHLAYDAVQHRFWRFRHNRANDTVNWEVSPDGTTWTVLRSEPRPFSITDLQIRLIAGKWSATTPTTTATFDNLWHEPNPTPPLVMADNFDDNLINPAMWATPDQTSPTIVSELNGRIEVMLQPNIAAYNALHLARTFDFRDKTLQVEVQPASQAGGVETSFQLYFDNSNYFIFGAGAGSLTCDALVNGVRDRTSLDWDDSRFWRFRHDADANTVNFETSMDGTTWATRKTVTPAFPLNTLRAALAAGASGTGNSAPGAAIFDNFRLERYRPLFPQSDNFNDNVRDARKWNAPTLPDFVIAEQNGRLEIRPGTTSANYDGYQAATTFDLTDARASVQASTVQRIDGLGSYFVLRHSVGNDLVFGIRGSNLVMQQEVGGVITAPTLPYDAVQHRFWRFRHNRANDTMNWETSPDGATWTTQSTMPTPFPITNLQTLLIAGKQTAAIPTGTALFDNLRIERNEGGLARTGSNTVNDAPPANAAPQVNAGSDATVNEGGTFSGTASFTDIDNTDTWMVTVDYGDGTGAQPVAPTPSKTIPLSHVYKDNAANPYMVTVTVTDAAGASSTDTAVVMSVNAPPTPVITGAQSTIREETGLTLGSTVSDPGEADTAAGFKYRWTVTKYGVAYTPREVSSQSTFNFWEWAGTYVVTLHVMDKDGGAGTTSTTITVNKIEQNDNFDDNSMDTLRWYVKGAPYVTVAEQNGQLQVTTHLSTLGYDGYYGRRSFDLTTHSAAVEAVKPAYNAGLDTYFALEDVMITGNRLLFAVRGYMFEGPGSLLMEEHVNDTVTSRTQIPYDAAQHRFWRFRRDPATDTLNWETSPDSTHWTVRHTAPRRPSLTRVRAQLYAGRRTSSGGSPRTAVFDNYRVEDVPQPPTISFSDNFDDNLLDSALWTVDDPASSSSVSEQNQRLEVLLASAYIWDTGNSIKSASFYNFWNRTLQVEVPRVSQVQGSTTYFELHSHSVNYSMSVTSNMLNCDVMIDTTHRTSVAYSASAHRFWRFRHDAAAHTINFEVSADGHAWTTLKTVPETEPLDSMRVVIGARNEGSTSDTSVFDNVKMEANQ
ncbi:MAG TPA: S8 family serine peptidase [Pyrinomonadaceae bacterium]